MNKYDNFRNKTGNRKNIPANKIIAWIENNFEFKTRKGGSEYLICNPLDGDTDFKFNINPENGVCHYWRGNQWAGPINPVTNKRNCSVVKFVKLYRKCSYREAIAELLGSSEDISSYLRPEGRVSVAETRKFTIKLPSGTELLSTSRDKQASLLNKWLISRGYTLDQIERAELYHLGMNVYWPYFEFEVLVYWQSRSSINKRFEFPSENIYDDNNNIIGKTDGTKGDFFYGFDSIEPASYVIITEAIFCQNTLYDQCLASGGADLTTNQINKLKILGPRKGIILSPDNDKAGISSIIRNKQVLQRLNFPIYYSIPPKIEYIDKNGDKKYTKDWNDIFVNCRVSKDEIRRIHDSRITKLTTREIIRLRSKCIK